MKVFLPLFLVWVFGFVVLDDPCQSPDLWKHMMKRSAEWKHNVICSGWYHGHASVVKRNQKNWIYLFLNSGSNFEIRGDDRDTVQQHNLTYKYHAFERRPPHKYYSHHRTVNQSMNINVTKKLKNTIIWKKNNKITGKGTNKIKGKIWTHHANCKASKQHELLTLLFHLNHFKFV